MLKNRAVDYLKEICQHELFDLGDHGSENLRGIYSPKYETEYIDDRLNAQFTSGAEYYEKAYTNHKMYRSILSEGFGIGGLDISKADSILDIGSGAGNSVIPLIEMFPDARVIASDLSVELLCRLNGLVCSKYPERDVALVQLDAEELAFSDDSFDILCGAAILHHLFNPEKTINAAARVLKKGGLALFTEPMQSVNFVVRMLYSILLKDPRSQELPERLRKYIGLRVKFFDDRVTTDKSQPQFRHMDDKWMFPKRYLMDVAKTAGFSEFFIKPMGNPKTRIRTKMNTHMVLGFGIQFNELPGWFVEIVDEFDDRLPDHMAMEDIVGDSIIVLVK